MANKLYDLSGEDSVVFPDSSVVKSYGREIKGFELVNYTNVLFPDVSDDLEGSEELKNVMTEMQKKSDDPEYMPGTDEVKGFGIHANSKDVVKEIMSRYVKVCRDMKKNGLGFGPGIQYNFKGFDEKNVHVTFSNYGLFFATLIEASKDKKYKEFLIKRGEKLFGARDAFFVNPPATNTVVESKDGILFVNRGTTAEYPFMYHQVAAGHHKPVKEKNVSLKDLIAQQIFTETGVGADKVSNLKFNGIALSSGWKIPGTEKAEILTSAKIDLTSDQIYRSISEKAPHRWETRQLLSVPREHVGEVIIKTFDSEKGNIAFKNVKIYSLDDKPMTVQEDMNSVSYWVPVGAAGLLMDVGRENYCKYLPDGYSRDI